MTGFDGEWYLRRSGEDALTAGQDVALLADRARALVAVGEVDGSVADSVVAGYHRAPAVRGRERHPYRWHDSVQPSPAPAPAPHRTYSCRATFAITWGMVTVRYVMLGADQTEIGVTVADVQHGSRRGHVGPPQLTVRDDQGSKITARFGGGGSDDRWEGRFSGDGGLSTSTRWLELDGTRVELGPEIEPARVRVEARCDTAQSLEQRAADYLDYCLASSREYGALQDSAILASLDALIDCGALAPDSSAVATVRATLDALDGGSADLTRLTPPWRSLVEGRARPRQGPRGWLPVGTTTPVFDGLHVTVVSLTSAQQNFSVEFRAAGPVTTRDWTWSVLSPILAFWAVDDLGNHYLGTLASHSGGPNSLEGDAEFHQPLHPAAIRLDLIISTGRARAVVEVPLRFVDET